MKIKVDLFYSAPQENLIEIDSHRVTGLLIKKSAVLSKINPREHGPQHMDNCLIMKLIAYRAIS